MAEMGQVQILTEPEGTVITLPEQEADFSFRRGSMAKRVLSAIVAGFALLCIAFPWLWFSAREPSHKLRFWQGQMLDYLVAGFLVGFVVMLTAMAWFVAAQIVLGFWPTQDQFEVGPDLIIARRRQWIWRRTRRISDISTIGISPPRTIARDWADRALEKKTACLIARTSDGRQVWLTERRPYPLIRETANVMAQVISRARWSHAPLFEDMVDDQARQRDCDTPPAGIEYRVTRGDMTRDRDRDAITITPVRSTNVLVTLLRSGIFRAGIFWLVLPYPLCLWMANTWPEEAGIMRKAAPMLSLFFAVPGLMTIAVMCYALMQERRYVISGEHLTQAAGFRFWQRRRRWERKAITAIRVTPHAGDKGRYSDRLQVLLASGETVALEGGNFHRLQYLATLLRRELAIGVDARINPAETRSKLTPPAKCPFTIRDEGDILEITHVPQGRTPSAIMAMAMGIVLVAASAIGPILAWRHLKGDERSLLVLLVLLFGGMGIALVLTSIYEHGVRWQLRLDQSGLSWNKRSAFGQKQVGWTRDQIGAVTAKRVFHDNPRSSVRLSVVDANDQSTALVSGEAQAMQYAAALLQHRLSK